MNILENNTGFQIKDISINDEMLTVDLMDGRIVSVPIAWYPRLLNGNQKQRNNWQICGGGFGIHWPDLDEDLSVEGILRGAPAPGVKK